MALLLTACSDKSGAEKALDDQGFTNIVTTGWSFIGCGKDDLYATGFTATNPKGKSVTGVVCSGMFKGSTIRTF